MLETEPLVQDPEKPTAAVRGPGVVEFDRVTFTYPGAEAPVLADISFTARPGGYSNYQGYWRGQDPPHD